MGMKLTDPGVQIAIRKGLITPEQLAGLPPIRPEAAVPEPKPALAVAAARRTARGGVWVLPVPVPSLANERAWQMRNRVAQVHRKAVSRAFGPRLPWLAPVAEHVHFFGLPVRCVLTRLGGRALDKAANLPAALKYVEDGVCFVLGIDDADPRWVCEFAQEPGGPGGVRVEIETVNGGAS